MVFRMKIPAPSVAVRRRHLPNFVGEAKDGPLALRFGTRVA